MGRLIREYEVASRSRSDLEHSPEVQAIELQLKEDPYNGELWMERGLALAKQFLYREAEESYSRAIAADPFRGIYYRHRAHRFLSCHRFEDACADFCIASRLIPENWDVWYHLGLSWFLLGDYGQALKAYRCCEELSHTDADRIAISDWLWITLQRLGLDDEAEAVLDDISEHMDPGDNTAYFQRLLMYKGLRSPEALLSADDTAINVLTMGFGLANYYEVTGDRAKAEELLREVIRQGDENDLYFAFGYLAAMVDLEKL